VIQLRLSLVYAELVPGYLLFHLSCPLDYACEAWYISPHPYTPIPSVCIGTEKISAFNVIVVECSFLVMKFVPAISRICCPRILKQGIGHPTPREQIAKNNRVTPNDLPLSQADHGCSAPPTSTRAMLRVRKSRNGLRWYSRAFTATLALFPHDRPPSRLTPMVATLPLEKHVRILISMPSCIDTRPVHEPLVAGACN